tara:strand:+ start:1275 stop:1571 length:297 start_codon:yes stop_codon:yes gene_type:complete
MDVDYYKNYKGPRLTSATMYDKDVRIDITEKIVDIYTDNFNWGGKLWKYNEIFPESKGKNIHCEFIDDTGRKHWFNTFVEDEGQYFNPPLATPINQNI